MELGLIIIEFIFLLFIFFFVMFFVLLGILFGEAAIWYIDSLRVGKTEYEVQLGRYLKKRAKDYVSDLKVSTYDRLKLPVIDYESTDKSIHCIEGTNFLDINDIEFNYIYRFVHHNVKGEKNKIKVIDQLRTDYPQSSMITGCDNILF
jgi:hypothetical protein